MHMGRTRAAYVRYTASLILFGSNGIVAAYIAASSTSIVFWRTLIGSLALIAVFMATRQHLTVFGNAKDCLFMIASGVSTGLSWIFLYAAYRLAGVGISTLIYYLGPILVMAVSPILFHEPLTRGKLLAFAAVLVGMVLLNGNTVQSGGDLTGILFAFGSAMCHAFMVVFNKLAARVQGLENPTLQLTISFLTVAVAIIVVPSLTLEVPFDSWLPMIFLGLVNTGLGCYLYFSSIGDLKAQTVVVLGYLEPLSAVVMAVMILGEVMSPAQVVGAVLVLGGALVAEALPSKSKASKSKAAADID